MKKLCRLLALVLAVALIFSLSACSFSLEKNYKDFTSLGEERFQIPGLDTTFVPQGICYHSLSSTFFVTGYNTDKSASPIYLIDEKSGKVEKTITLKNEDGSEYVGHAGGIATASDTLWISSDRSVKRVLMSDIVSANDGESVQIVDSFKTEGGGATLYSDGEYLWAAEFYEKKDYQTSSTHHLKTPSGDTNHAIALAYKISQNDKYGIKSQTPELALSIPDKVQGMVIDDGKIIFSTSYGRKNHSNIYLYENVLANKANGEIDISGDKVPLYFADKAYLKSSLLAPPMTEGLCYINGRTYVLFESSAQKYVETTKLAIDKVWELLLK